MSTQQAESQQPKHAAPEVQAAPEGVPWLAPAAALQFLTICPPVVRRLFSDRELGAAIGWFPVVGLALGGVLWGLSVLLGQVWSPMVVAALLLGVWVVMTGALHIDGLLDFCDGIFGGRTREARLEILRDHRVGAYAVAGGVLLLLVKYAALVHLTAAGAALVVAPVVGRWLMALAVWRYHYARDEGLGRTMREQARGWDAALATALALVLVGLLGGSRGLLAVAAALLVGWLIARLALARIGGLTGDCYGAICELGEAAVLLAWCAEVA